ncbi:MAG: hypothetical protein LBD75_06320 [Candidatus Peribacteria bacterium]|jgi:hypothetical protein|nr:hypothetical protein [Candidatus Peribacteria bacterium]
MQSIGMPKGVTVLEYPGLKTTMSSDKEHVNACETFSWDIDYNHDGTAANSITTLTVRLPNTVSLAAETGAISHSWTQRAYLEGSLPSAFQPIETNSNVVVNEVNGETVINININGYLGYDLQPGRGGTLRVKVKANCDTVSDTLLIGTVVGYYENAMNF